jgi:two-component system phosphate regulon response regulator PhoB
MEALKKIVLIEDDPVGRTAIQDYLTAHGYEVHAAHDGAKGLALARELAPDLVLCDVLLPLKSGFEVCFELKRDPHPAPVLLMSAVLRGEEEQRYGRDGVHADGYMVKPFAMGAMLSRIRHLIGH